MRGYRRKIRYIQTIRRIEYIVFVLIWGTGGDFWGLGVKFLTERNKTDTFLGWNLTLANKNHAIPVIYEIELTELSNGKKADT